jgi:hypothetical protein
VQEAVIGAVVVIVEAGGSVLSNVLLSLKNNFKEIVSRD